MTNPESSASLAFFNTIEGVPEDFPRGHPILGSLPEAQPEVARVQVDGRFYAEGQTPEGIQAQHALCKDLAHQGVEGVAPGGVEFGGLPVHPLLDACPRSRFGRQQVMALVQAHQVTADGVGFPQHAVFIEDHRDLGIGVQGQEFGRLGRGETDAPVLTLVGDVQFLAGPQDFSYVDGRSATQDFQRVSHGASLTMVNWQQAI